MSQPDPSWLQHFLSSSGFLLSLIGIGGGIFLGFGLIGYLVVKTVVVLHPVTEWMNAFFGRYVRDQYFATFLTVGTVFVLYLVAIAVVVSAFAATLGHSRLG